MRSFSSINSVRWMSHIAGDATPAPKLNQRLWDLKVMWLSAEVKQTLFCSARASRGCSFQAKISAQSNKYLHHWEHPSLPQEGTDSSSVGGLVSKYSLGFHLLYACNKRRWFPGDQGGNWVCPFAVKLHMCWLFDQAFLILYCKLYPPFNKIIVCVHYTVIYRQV